MLQTPECHRKSRRTTQIRRQGGLFTDQENDPETGLQYFGARYYDPWVGRFMSQDPGLIGATPGGSFIAVSEEPGSFNAYTYALNRPTRMVDPNGRQAREFLENVMKDPAGAAAGVIEGAAARQSVVDPDGILDALVKAGVIGAGLLAGSEIAKKVTGDSNSDGKGTVTRYMSSGEAKVARETGQIPNTDPAGNERPTHVTTDAPTDSASGAKETYELDTTPTHRATVPASRVTNLGPAPGGKTETSGGGAQSATTDPIPVQPNEIHPLNK